MNTELEKRIKSEFDNLDIDCAKILKVEQRPKSYLNPAETVRRVNMRRRYLNRSVRRGIIAIAILLSVTITAVAAGSYLGAFDKLREIIGDKKAGMLQPVEISNIVGEVITDDGIRIELVAVGVISNVVDFYFTLEDMTGNRLDGDITISATVFPPDEQQPWSAIIQSPEVINRTEEGIVTLRSRQQFSRPIAGQELQFSLRYISYNRRSGEHTLDLDLSSLTPQTPVAWLWETPVLQPHLHDIEPEISGFDNTWNTALSSIGIIDGKLHIQQIQEPPSPSQDARVYFALADQNGEYVPPYTYPQWPMATLSFEIDENGSFINEAGHMPFREDIYEIDTARLSEYRVVAVYNAEDRIYPNWDVSFEIDFSDNTAELVADDLDVELESNRAILREVRITPYNVIITADYLDNSSVSPSPVIVINTADGTVTPAEGSMMFINRFDDSGKTLVGFTIVRDLVDDGKIELFDIASVTSVEIEGNIIELQ